MANIAHRLDYSRLLAKTNTKEKFYLTSSDLLEFNRVQQEIVKIQERI